MESEMMSLKKTPAGMDENAQLEGAPSRHGRHADSENAELEEEASSSPKAPMPSDMSLEKIVLLPTWREMLLDLVHQNTLDPWNIDVVDIATKYLERIRKIETSDLRIPANLILAAAILLRFKSDALQLEEQVQQDTLETYIEEGVPVEIPMLELRSRIPPKRRVTLDELLNAMEKVFQDSASRETVLKQVTLPANMEIKLSEFNVEEKIREVFGKVSANADSEGWVTFSSLLGENSREEIIYTLLPLLYLAQEQKVTVLQEKFFGEIFIKVYAEGKKGKGA